MKSRSSRQKGEDSDKEQQSTEVEKKKEDREDKDNGDEPETAADTPVNIQSTFAGNHVIDHTLQRLEGIAYCSNSPQGTIDEQSVPVPQDGAVEKVRTFFILLHCIFCF